MAKKWDNLINAKIMLTAGLLLNFMQMASAQNFSSSLPTAAPTCPPGEIYRDAGGSENTSWSEGCYHPTSAKDFFIALAAVLGVLVVCCGVGHCKHKNVNNGESIRSILWTAGSNENTKTEAPYTAYTESVVNPVANVTSKV